MACDQFGEFVSGNNFIRPMRFQKAGDRVDGHAHNFDHTTLVLSGAVHVKAHLLDGTVLEKDFTAFTWFLVKAGVRHEISALEPNTLAWCVYSHRTPDGTIVPEYTGWRSAYV